MEAENREHRRYQAAVAAEVDLDGEIHMGETRDISIGGVAAILSLAPPEGQEVELALILTQDGIEDAREEPFEVKATVMWVAPSDDGASIAGLRFLDVEPTQTARLNRFLAALAEN